MDFHILGSLEALDEGRDVAPAGGKQRALLALLLVHANETVSIERLIDELWGESPPATAASSRQATPRAPQRRSRRRSRCGVARRLRASAKSRSSGARGPAWTICGRPRSRT